MEKDYKLDRRKKRTRQLLKNALISLLTEKDFHSITVQDITNLADVNRATFYSHYHDKHDFFQQLIDDILNEFEGIFVQYTERKDPKDLEPKPYDLIVCAFQHFKHNADFYNVMLSPKGVPGFYGKLNGIIHAAADRRRVRLQIDASQLAVPQDIMNSYISSVFLGVIIQWLKNEMPYTSEYMAKKLTYILLRK
ncbi:TetR/AcrR family transcriptional regulator [Peribacillus loiseleuriae]|uniref:TetR/AcrR family transcriptional regulator n=1 Tax=Peribacillus loiseleuriae TaxID=1679170 RepID=UPI00381A3769